MKKIYKSFEELLSHNETIFTHILKNGHKGIIRACWDARQGEVEQLINKIKHLEGRVLKEDKSIKERDEKLNNFSQLENELSEATEYIEELRDYGEQVKQAVEMAKADTDSVRAVSYTHLTLPTSDLV